MEIDSYHLVDSLRKMTEQAVFTLKSLIVSCGKKNRGSNTY